MNRFAFNGIINIYKEKDYTSHDVVAIVRRTLTKISGEKVKVGHTGTLDPNACGVLPICLGRGTKFVDEIMAYDKVYKAELFLGFETDTLDITGEKRESDDKKHTKEDIEKAILSFVGTYDQVPPMYSAIKVNGQKMYDLARKGKEVDLPPRTITIDNIEVLEIDETNNRAVFTVGCKKGTYIRALCRDIGYKLGTYGTMGDLERIATSNFTIENSVTIEEIKKCETYQEAQKYIISILDLLKNLEEVRVSRKALKFIINGNRLDKNFCTSNSMYCERNSYKLFAKNSEGEEKFLGVYEYSDGFFLPKILYDIEV